MTDSIQAPIDRPLASAYLREFSSWSTAYPPGLSDPTSLRVIENVLVTREGAARIRPGIRSVFTEDWWLGTAGEKIVGSFEHYIYDTSGRIALLFAVRGGTGGDSVRFRTVVYNSSTHRFDDEGDFFPGVFFGSATTYVKYLQIDNKILALSNDPEEPAIIFFVGEEKSAKKLPIGGLTLPEWTDAPVVGHPTQSWILDDNRNTRPAFRGPGGTVLISDDPAKNTYSFAYFYTFETEFGETSPSGIQTIKTQRGWAEWEFNEPDPTNGGQTSTIAIDPRRARDQLVAMLPEGQYDQAKALGAIKWNLYQFTWNDSGSVPSVATLLGSKDITEDGTEATESWIQNTAAALAQSYVVPVPNENNRENYSGAPTSRQGIAVSDRLILVNDGENAASIRWSANVPGEYTNFSPSKGGGVKTLSSGNLLVPLNVQLWQNPQATDTLCITAKGLNGYHAAFYMAPASVSGQSDSTIIMGFEETTATPGTISPYGVEVLGNSLYHPLEAELMKSSAANYAINHKTMTEEIVNRWQRLANKENIISAQHDNRLYYIVNNPEGEDLEEGCMGNEVWVLDVAGENPGWSRWLVQGISLRKLQIGNKLYMAIVRPDAIFIFDERAYKDEYAEGADTLRRAIPWRIETNTLGANNAHDMWAFLYQANLSVGDWLGSLQWGIRGYDVHGQKVEKRKRSHASQDSDHLDLSNGLIHGEVELGDSTDSMIIQRDMMEWTFFAGSLEENDEAGEPVTQDSYGQINFARFMMLQSSKNVNAEEGSLQTFEYRRNAQNGTFPGTDLTRNGLPMPRDVSRP